MLTKLENGQLLKSADTGDNISVSSGDLSVNAIVSESDPAYVFRKRDGNPFARESGTALIAYHRGGSYVGWSNNDVATPSTILYGAKDRDVIRSGTAYTYALPLGDPVHVIILTEYGAQHISLYGNDQYLSFVHPLVSTSSNILFPAVLGKVAKLPSLYVYDIDPVSPNTEISTPAQGQEFNRPAGAYLVEFTVTAHSLTTPALLVLDEQDADNRLELTLSTSAQLTLNKRENGTPTKIFENVNCPDGSHVLMQIRPPERFITPSGAGSNTVKAYIGASSIAVTVSVPFANQTLGRFDTLPAGTTISNFRLWTMALT
jgi:hypothetical protein